MEDLEHRNSSDNGAHIDDLPDEVLLLILRRLEDAKCLCRCYLVSKRFASLIPHIQNVIFSIPDPDSSPINSYSNPSISDSNGETQKNFPKNVLILLFNNLLTKPFHYLRQITGGPSSTLPSPSSAPAFDSVAFVSGMRFLKRFREIERLEIRTPCFHAQDPSLLKWEAGVGKDSIFCVSLFSSSEEDSDENGGDLNNPEAFALTNELLRDRVEIAYQCFMEALWRRHVLRHVVADHHKTLEEARFTDQKGNGTVCLRKEQVANLQDLMRAKEPVDLRAAEAGYMKVWHVSELQTPKTGRVMRGVTAVLIGVSEDEDEESGGGGGGDGCMEEVFKEDEVLGEALRMIYESIRDDALAVTLDLNIPH